MIMETLFMILLWVITAVLTFKVGKYFIENKFKYVFDKTTKIIIGVVSLIPVLNLVGIASLIFMYYGNKTLGN